MHSDEKTLTGRFASCPESPNCVSSFAEESDTEHFIAPYILDMTVQQCFSRLRLYLEQRKDAVIITAESDSYIHAVFTSGFFRFKDDVEFGFETAAGGVKVNISSRSRTGYSDLGVNRKRMEEIRAFLSE